MPTDQSQEVEDRIAEFDQALMLLERARISGDAKMLARATQHARIALYTGTKRLEHLQPSPDQWAMIDDRMQRLERWTVKDE